jgi:protein gp37
VGDHSRIGWTNATWNPILAVAKKTGKRGWFCIHKSEGCRICYAELMNRWRGNGLSYVAKNLAEVEIELNTEGNRQSSLTWPIRARKPRKIFVCSMTDLFGRFIPEEFIDMIFGAITLAPHHQFQILTKEPARMLGYISTLHDNDRVMNAAFKIGAGPVGGLSERPLKNVLLGCSVEDQENADLRRQYMRVIAQDGWPTWVSYEPALGNVDWTGWEFIKWLVSGGESGDEAQPSHPYWHIHARDFCRKNKIAYFFKQWGKWEPRWGSDDPDGLGHPLWPDGRFVGPNDWRPGPAMKDSVLMYRTTKKKTPVRLEGNVYEEFPLLSLRPPAN